MKYTDVVAVICGIIAVGCFSAAIAVLALTEPTPITFRVW